MSSALGKTFLKFCASTLRTQTPNVRLTRAYTAAVLKERGKPLELHDQKQAKLSSNQVRVRVSYCSVNSIDCTGFRDEKTKLPFIPGYEISGEVIEVGKSIKPEQIIKGEKVAALSFENFGGFAEECVVNIEDVWRLPSNVELKDAAVIVCGHSTAMFAFSKLRKPKENDIVLITAGPAGLGLAAVDVAASIFKAKVIGVTDNEERGELLRQKGAFQTLHFSPKLKKDVLKATKQKGVSFVYDAVAEHMLETITTCIAPEGQIFYAAPVTYTNIAAPPQNSSLTIVNLHTLKQQNLELYKCIVGDTLDLADQGVIGAHISATFNLENVNQAIEYIEGKKCTGKVVIEVD